MHSTLKIQIELEISNYKLKRNFLRYFPGDTDCNCVESKESYVEIRAMVLRDELYSFPCFNTVHINVVNDEE